MLRRRPPAAAEISSSSCMLVDRAAAQFEVHEHVGGDGRGGFQRLDVLRVGVDARVNSPTSAQLRRAWMPPEVAQAPMATRNLQSRRTWRMRCSSSAVETLPFDQADVVGRRQHAAARLQEVRDLHRPDDVQQLVLQIQRLNWQPSQLENLYTASLGLPSGGGAAGVGHGYISSLAKMSAISVKQKTGPSLQTNFGPVLAVPAAAEAAVHVALQAHVDLRGRARGAAGSSRPPRG